MSNPANEKANAVYATMCSYFERSGYEYQKYDDQMTITFEGKQTDVPMPSFIFVFPENELICCNTVIPVGFSKHDRYVAAAAANMANSRIIDGIFEYSMRLDRISYRDFCSYTDREIPEAIISYLVNCSLQTVDVINDKIKDLAEEKIDLEDFWNFINGL